MRGSAIFFAAALGALAWGLAPGQSPRRGGFSVRITEPPNQSIVLGRTKLAAAVEIERPELIDRVEFLVGDEVVFIDREPPYECSYDFGEEARSWVIRVVAHHAEEVSVSDAVITRKPAFIAVEHINRIVLWMSGTNQKGKPLPEIDRSVLRIEEDGVPQEILEFYRDDQPLNLAILLDSSGSMRDKLKPVHEAASAFVGSLREEDRALVIDFNDKVFLIQDLTADHAALKEAIGSTEALGGTALYDALHAAYRKIGNLDGRKAIILLSDGEDTSSQFGHDRVIEEAKSNNALVYSIGIEGGGAGARRGLLRDLADVTGGEAFFVKGADEIAEAYARIADELRTQHQIVYSTSNEVWDGRWIKVLVESSDPAIEVRARRGYFAVRRSGD